MASFKNMFNVPQKFAIQMIRTSLREWGVNIFMYLSSRYFLPGYVCFFTHERMSNPASCMMSFILSQIAGSWFRSISLCSTRAKMSLQIFIIRQLLTHLTRPLYKLISKKLDKMMFISLIFVSKFLSYQHTSLS